MSVKNMMLVLLPAPIAAALAFSSPLAAQQQSEEQRSNHYLDHVVLAVSDLEQGMAAFEAKTGVKPRKDGNNPALGTQSAIVGLGDNRFLEIIAPDPKADPDQLDPDLRRLVYDRLTEMAELTPLRWAIGTSNLERTTQFMRRAGSRPSEIMAGSRERGWGRAQSWSWVKVNIPDYPVSPFFIEWTDESKRPQERAPEGCTLQTLHVNSRNYKSVLNLVATMQIDVELNGSDSDSLAFDLDCPAGEISFESGSLTESHYMPANRQTRN